MRALDAPVEALVEDAFRFAVSDLYTVAAWVGVLSVLVALTIPHVPLRETIDENPAVDGVAGGQPT